MSINDPRDCGGPVFPCRIPTGGKHKVDEPPPTTQHFGMTLRDYFAAKAMNIAFHAWNYEKVEGAEQPDTAFTLFDDEDRERVASLAYNMADAMLRARDFPQ